MGKRMDGLFGAWVRIIMFRLAGETPVHRGKAGGGKGRDGEGGGRTSLQARRGARTREMRRVQQGAGQAPSVGVALSGWLEWQ